MAPVYAYGYSQFIFLVWIMFGITMSIANIIGIYLKWKNMLTLYFGIGFIYALCFVDMFDYTPNRASTIIVNGIVSILIGYLAIVYLKNRKAKSNNG